MIVSRDGTHIHTRSDTSTESQSQSQSQSDDTASQNQIIIGVVVGGVAFIAITAGIILFVHIRKRKQDRHSRPAQQLLPLHIPPAYKATTAILPFPERPDSSSPPAYQAALPVYDPSKYQSLNWQSIGPGASLTNMNPVYYPDPRRSFKPVDNRLTIQRLSGVTSVEFPPRQSGMSLDWSRPSNDSSTLWSNGGMSRSLSSESSDERRALSVTGEGNRRPRRPKPVLSRLITNFN